MQEALIGLGVLVVATIVGSLLKATEDQLRPLTPQVSSGETQHNDHHNAQH